jgi:hypothetical protein
LFGVTERDALSNFTITETADLVTLHSKASNTSYTFGRLLFFTTASSQLPPSHFPTKFTIVHGHGPLSHPPHLTHLVYSMNHPQFNGATYQIFSRFDCRPLVLEGPSPLTHLASEGTPSAHSALATAPATVYRHYLIGAPVNLIDGTPLRVCGGAALLNASDFPAAEQFDWSDLSRYKVGVQRRCPVILKRNLHNFQRVPAPAEVHQVFCSALNFSIVKRCALTVKISEALLEAQYRATILAARENARLFPGAPGTRTLFLTMLGCGDFENPPDLVCDAILRCRDAIAASGLQIFLVCASESEFEAAARLRGLAEALGGGVVETAQAADEVELAFGECGCWSRVFAAAVVLLIALILAVWIWFLMQRHQGAL